MADFAVVADIEDAWRPLTDSEKINAAYRIRQASALVRREVHSVDDDLSAGTVSADLVSGVVVDMVLRLLRNPEGKVQESIDDYAYRRSDAVAGGALYISAEEIALLSSARRGAFTIRPSA